LFKLYRIAHQKKDQGAVSDLGFPEAFENDPKKAFAPVEYVLGGWQRAIFSGLSERPIGGGLSDGWHLALFRHRMDGAE